MLQTRLADLDFVNRAVSPFMELGAYEYLWGKAKTSFKSIAKQFASEPGALPSDFVDPKKATETANIVHNRFKDIGVHKYGVRVHGACEYPLRLRAAEHPIELLYYQGCWDFANSIKSIAVVGTRNPSEEGVKRTRRLVRSLLEDDFTIVSGLARGVDTIAHRTTIEERGRTIAVLGTPLGKVYPKENARLQDEIAKEHLLISQVPLKRYESVSNPVNNRHFFPSRNITMSALTDATVIVEAGETSGTLIQARAALKQGRKLFILESCFRNPNLTWPRKFEEQGAFRVKEYNDIKRQFVPKELH